MRRYSIPAIVLHWLMAIAIIGTFTLGLVMTDIQGISMAKLRYTSWHKWAGVTILALRPRGVWSVCDDGASLPGSAAIQLAFRVPPPAVDACHAELVAKGVPILREPTDLSNWRHRTLFFRDPEDNIIEIYAEF